MRDYVLTLEGKRVSITIKPEDSDRTEKQNRYYWGVIVRLLSDYTGHTPDEMHEILKYKFNPRVIDVDGLDVTVGGSTREMSTKEFIYYNERIQTWASTTLSVTIPNAGEVEYE